MAKGVAHRPSTISIEGDSASIELRRGGGFALIDASDAALVVGLSWRRHVSTSGGIYAATKILGADGKRHTVYLHRRVLGGELPIDHRDRDGLNNRRANLRFCSPAQNARNRGAAMGRKFKGVYAAGSGWIAVIRMDGVRHKSKRFGTEAEAAAEYDRMSAELHGEFGRASASTTVPAASA